MQYSTIWGSSAGADANEFSDRFYGANEQEKERMMKDMQKEIVMLRAENETLRTLCNNEGIRWQPHIHTTRLRVKRREELKKGCLGWC